MPVPLAAGLYGVLLGLGFTTFILSFAVWALAGISVALGEPQTGLLIGLAFGAGRALPVIGARARPAAGACTPRWPSVRGSCGACARSTRSRSPVTAAALAVTPAQAAVKVDRRPATATSASTASSSPCTSPARPASSAAPRASSRCPATTRRSAAAGWRTSTGASVVVQGVAPIPAPGADALAVSTNWVAWRAAGALYAASLDPTQTTQPRRRADRQRRQAEPGRQRPGVRARRADRDATTWRPGRARCCAASRARSCAARRSSATA